MPNGWVHATVDLIAFSRSYFDLHRQKDRLGRKLGSGHRKIGHDWYWQFERSWTFSEPFPDSVRRRIARLGQTEGSYAAERAQASIAHDHLDRVWDGLSKEERKYWEGFFLWLLLHPDVLKCWAGVDVMNGSINRLVQGRNLWRPCPTLRDEYARLLRYAESVRGIDPAIRQIVVRFDESFYGSKAAG
jgi:hypothetical protein